MNYTLTAPAGYAVAAFVFASDAARFAIQWRKLQTTYYVHLADGTRLTPGDGEELLDFTKRLVAAQLELFPA